MARLLSKSESAVFWKEDEEYLKVMGISMTEAHRKVLKHRIRKKIGYMIDLITTTPLDYVPEPKAFIDMIDRNIRKIRDNKDFLDQEAKDTLAIALKCYAYDLESEESKMQRAEEIVKETKAFHKQFKKSK